MYILYMHIIYCQQDNFPDTETTKRGDQFAAHCLLISRLAHRLACMPVIQHRDG